MDIFFPVAGISISLFVILGLGGMVGLLSGLFGVGGGFLMTPLLMMLGVPPAVAVASDTNQIVAASASATLAHTRNRNVDFKLGFIMLVGGMIGGSLGALVVKMLRSLGNFDFFLKITYVVMLSLVGTFMLIESINSLRNKESGSPKAEEPAPVGSFMRRLPARMYFEISGIESSAVALFVFGLFIGMLSALMGVGGGFIMLPVMIYFIGMQTQTAVGTSIFVVFFTAVNVTLAQSILNHTVDLLLAIVLLIGSSTGAQFGAMLGKKLKGGHLRMTFSVIVLLVTVKMLAGLLADPSDLIVEGGGH